jgi:hypothetical protein
VQILIFGSNVKKIYTMCWVISKTYEEIGGKVVNIGKTVFTNF